MIKKFSIFFLILLFSLGIFKGVSAKLNAPTVLQVLDVGEGSAKVSWEWSSGGGTIKRFVLSYRIAGAGESWTKRYPSADVQEFMIMGLTENTTYEWTIMAEAVNPSDNSIEATGTPFTTKAGAVDGDHGDDGGPVSLFNPLGCETLECVINAVINFLVVLAFAVGPILIIYAAFLILTAAGKAEQINKGKTIILWTLIALTIILLAKGLPSIIKGAVGG